MQQLQFLPHQLSISLISRKAIPVEITPSHRIEKIALLEGNCEGKLKMVNGRKIDASTRDQPIKTIVFVLYANF